MPVDLAPLALAALLGWSGAGKLTARSLAGRAGSTPLARLLGTPRRAAVALRLLGAVEVLLAAALLAAPPGAWPHALPGEAATALGVAFLGYLAWARATAPGSPCGCTGGQEPVTWRAFVRAALVAGGGVAATFGGHPWWSATAAHPVGAAALLAATAAAFTALSAEPHRWLLPLRRARIRLFGHPLSGTGTGIATGKSADPARRPAGAAGDALAAATAGPAPVAATVELLERSLAWEQAAPVVRSGLVEHWDADGWRVLRYTGLRDGKPVSVLFALDADATSATAPEPVVRLAVVEEPKPAEPEPAPT